MIRLSYVIPSKTEPLIPYLLDGLAIEEDIPFYRGRYPKL